MILSTKNYNLIVGFLINVSSAYFVAAMLSLSTSLSSLENKFISFGYNIISATMYFILSVVINEQYE